MRRPATPRKKPATYEKQSRETLRLKDAHDKAYENYLKKACGGPGATRADRDWSTKTGKEFYKARRALKRTSLAETYRKVPGMKGIKTQKQALTVYKTLTKRMQILDRNMKNKTDGMFTLPPTKREVGHMKKLEKARVGALRRFNTLRK